MEVQTSWETVIGLEIHVQLSTQSKVFCSDATAFGATPNSQVSVVSLAHPGTLPRLNRAVVEMAVQLGLALGGKINLFSTFDRKNYFYADLPKGYQITQDQHPISVGGRLPLGEGRGSMGIHHIHIEEDAGKSIHDQDPSDTLIDLNRSGAPLLEIVSLPDLRGAEDVSAAMETMRQLVRWLGISDGNMEEGSLRCDVNISVKRSDTARLGTRCEIKNVNSMRFARRAVEYESARQIALLEADGTVVQETRGFDPVTGETFSLREKEEAHDYRYFPDPDLPPVIISPTQLEDIESRMPLLPWATAARYQSEYGLGAAETALLTRERDTALYFDKLVGAGAPTRAAANLIINKLRPYADQKRMALSALPHPVSVWVDLINLMENGAISHTVAWQKLLPLLLEQPDASPRRLAEQMELLQSDDGNLIEQIADQVLARMPDKVAEYRKGKKGLLGLFMGELMKAAKGKVDPKTATQVLERKLKEEQ